jgi:hypothetical protein
MPLAQKDLKSRVGFVKNIAKNIAKPIFLTNNSKL